MKKLLVLISIACAIMVALLFVFIRYQLSSLEKTVLASSESIEFEIDRGSSLYRVKERLTEYAQISDIGFKLWLHLNPDMANIKTGLYEIEPNTYLIDFIKKLHVGDEKQFTITLVEGQTLKQWIEVLDSQDFLKPIDMSPTELYDIIVGTENNFCQNSYRSLEGCLLPDTYFYTAHTKAIDIVDRAFKQMREKLENAWQKRFKDIPLANQYEALTLASIIEKETAIPSERGEIAGVFVNRLEQNMRLQTDPTVIYGIGESFNGDITRKDLRTKTPYNTYIIKGLPITPIAMPSLASIEAALMPSITDSLYFVASGDGGHVFSTNLADHNKAVRQYLDKMKKN